MKATVLALSLLCSGAAFAQTPSTSASATTAAMSARAAQHMKNLATLLDLTDAQKVQVQAVLGEEHAKMRQAFEQARGSGSKPDFAQMKALHQQMQQETLQKLTPVLSALQLKKFQIIQQSMHPHHHHGPKAAAAAPPAQS